MTRTSCVVTLSPRDCDAVLFDLDGVLTRTASVHAVAWKDLFDGFLRERADATGVPFVPFDLAADYRRYVDGKPRRDGVVSFLASRGIELPEESPAGKPEVPSIGSLAARKDDGFLSALRRDGVEVYPDAIALVRSLRAEDVFTGVVSSSRNCAAVLEAAGIADLFDVRVDGLDVERHGLAGKPAPDTFLEAARRLRVQPSRTVVVEDAIVGVAAGRAGGFGNVIGVDRGGQSRALRGAGADVVVGSLAEVQVAQEPASTWSLTYDGFDPATEGIREALCALGNGYFTTRGAVAGTTADGVHYPGTYLAGGYNRLRTDVAGRVVENEDLVNLPDWLVLKWQVNGGEWFAPTRASILSWRQELDLRHGMLLRRLRVEDVEGRRTAIEERRLVSMEEPHLAALEIVFTPENWSGAVTWHTALDGEVVNRGAKLYERFNNRHLMPESVRVIGGDEIVLTVETSQSRVRVAQAARTRVSRAGARLAPARRTVERPGYVGQEFTVEAIAGQPIVVEKACALYTSRDRAISECELASRTAIARAGTFAALADAHRRAWRRLWRRFDIHLEPEGSGFSGLNALMLLRLNIFHLLQAVSPHSIDLDIGVPARGWTGEAYQGHVFWDELFIFPVFNHRMPEITRSLLMYRARRLGEAREAARRAGLRGAMFPWQSGSDGQEETQELNLNWRSGRWVPDNSWQQRHVGSAIAYNVWQYFQVTEDTDFLHAHGAELILSIAQFWSSLATFNAERERYEIRGVMGPDEYHEGYPWSDRPGLDNNAYTNVMAVWVLCRALDVLRTVSEMDRIELMGRLGITGGELRRWEDISHRMFVPFHDDGIISQFEGYEKLEELDWEAYRARYGNIQRMDLILEAEDDSANRYKLSKQADVLMLVYIFTADELRGLLERLGYRLTTAELVRNVEYYAARSSHGSTLSRVALAWVLARSDRSRAMAFFAEALQSDVSDIQGGTTAEGIHLGAMAGTVDLIQRVCTGIEVRDGVLRLHPRLPPELRRMEFRIRYRGQALDLRLTPAALTVRGRNTGSAPILLEVNGRRVRFESGSTRVFRLRDRSSRAVATRQRLSR